MQEKQWFISAFTVVGFIFIVAGAAIVYQQQQLRQLNQQLLGLESHSSQPLLATSNETTPSQSTSVTPTTTNPLGTLQQQIDDLSRRVTQLEKKIGVQNVNRQTNPAVKEYLIYLGSGQTSNRDWTDISSAVAAINTANYGQIKSVYFEAALSIIGGEAHARLENQTTGQILYQTEVFNNTSDSTWETSTPFVLPPGQNSYMVQLRSSSGEMAILSGSRIHVFLQ